FRDLARFVSLRYVRQYSGEFYHLLRYPPRCRRLTSPAQSGQFQFRPAPAAGVVDRNGSNVELAPFKRSVGDTRRVGPERFRADWKLVGVRHWSWKLHLSIDACPRGRRAGL